jgi:signal transduction histidine kinase
MKLTMKLVLVFMTGMLILIAVNAYVGIQRQVWIFEQVAVDRAKTIGDALEEMLQFAWRADGWARVSELIAEACEEQHRMRVRWVWFDPHAGAELSPSIPQLNAAVIERHEPVWGPEKDTLYVYWSIPVVDGRKGGLELYETASILEMEKRNVIYQTLLQMAATTALTGLLAVLMGLGVVGRPLERLVEKARRIGRGDLTGPVEIRSRDELQELAESLNQMCSQLAESQQRIHQESADRVAAMEQLRHADRLRTVGRLASVMAHDLGTPLNVISGRASLIASGKLSDQETIQSATIIKAESDKMTRTIRELLDFARRSPTRKTPVDLRRLVDQTIDLLLPVAEKHNVTITRDDEGHSAMASVDGSQIQQVLANLLVNAIQAMPGGGEVEAGIQRRRLKPPKNGQRGEAEFLCLSVRDEGVGIPPEILQRLFEPFFTTKQPGEGTGLGLSIAYGIAQEHDGWIDVTSKPGSGSCFSVYLPTEADS